MEEVIQLNLTETESIVLQAIVAVGIVIHLKNATALQKEIGFMELFMDEWPEASESLANKMTDLVKINSEMLKADGLPSAEKTK
jgi:hypothetical protein